MALEIVLILAIALGASALTFFSGFGLGTLLLPAFALVFPLDVAIAATAIVHLANNLWKALLVGRHAAWHAVRSFGIPAAIAAIAGAVLLVSLPEGALASYELAGAARTVTTIGLVVGTLIVVFALFDLVPALARLRLSPRHLVPGGLASGFFGGLTGHQGALRSIFLAKLDFTATQFVATGTLCAILVDASRIAVYATEHVRNTAAIEQAGGWGLIAVAAAMAFAGALLGARLLPKVTMEGVRLVVGTMLLVVGGLIAVGIV